MLLLSYVSPDSCASLERNWFWYDAIYHKLWSQGRGADVVGIQTSSQMVTHQLRTKQMRIKQMEGIFPSQHDHEHKIMNIRVEHLQQRVVKTLNHTISLWVIYGFLDSKSFKDLSQNATLEIVVLIRV